jgi:hypothetical protein
MQLYFFHFLEESIHKDEKGESFESDELALKHAERLARELSLGVEANGSSIIVTDGERQLFEVTLPPRPQTSPQSLADRVDKLEGSLQAVVYALINRIEALETSVSDFQSQRKPCG